MPTPQLVLAIPAYNEAAVIVDSVTRVREALKKTNLSWEVVVVDNGSTDGTADKVRASGLPNVSVISAEKGKGAAIWRGGQQAREWGTPLFGFIDADLSADPEHISDFLERLIRSEADIIIGSRLIDKKRVARGILRTLSSELFNGLRRLILGIPVRDTQCGLKLMNSAGLTLLQQCTERGWFLDMEFLARAHMAGLRIRELPVAWDEFRYAGRASKLNLVRDGVGAIIAMLRIRIGMLQS